MERTGSGECSLLQPQGGAPNQPAPPGGAGLATLEGAVVTPFEGDSRPHADTSCGVCGFFEDTQALRTRPRGALWACTCVLPRLLGRGLPAWPRAASVVSSASGGVFVQAPPPDSRDQAELSRGWPGPPHAVTTSLPLLPGHPLSGAALGWHLC